MTKHELSEHELARIGARVVYGELQAKLRALAAAFPDVIENFDEAAPRAPQTKPGQQSAALTTVLEQVLPAQKQFVASDVLPLVKATGYRFEGKDESRAVANALAELARTKRLKRVGRGRGTRYLLKAS